MKNRNITYEYTIILDSGARIYIKATSMHLALNMAAERGIPSQRITTCLRNHLPLEVTYA